MIVCVCNGVSDTTLRKHIAAGADSIAKLKVCTRAGTECGQCHAEMRRLLAEARVTGPRPLAAAAK